MIISSEIKQKQESVETILSSFDDIKGEKIEGSGLTPLTTPSRRSCAQLMIKNQQETSSLRPYDI